MSETIHVRKGAELDELRLNAFLRDVAGITGPVTVRQFAAGSSNLTYLLTVGEQEFVLRRPPFGNTVRSAHDMRREFDVLSKLAPHYPPAPRPIVFCEDESVIGDEFYIMERRTGVVLTFPEEQMRLASLSKTELTEICAGFMRTLAGLHSLDPKNIGLGELGEPAGYCRRQVEGWTARYHNSQTHEVVELESVIEWLKANIPPESGASIVHNDYKFDNVMLDAEDLRRVTTVLDWEMVTVGDPLMDLGTTLGYWMSADAGEAMLSMPFNPRRLMENVSRAELAGLYEHFSGRDASQALYYYVFGSFKIAVIAQQIYARYVRGATRDERFAAFDRSVAALGCIAAAAIDRGTL